MPSSSENRRANVQHEIDRRVLEYRTNLLRFYGNCPLFSSEIDVMVNAYRRELLAHANHPPDSLRYS